jgi:von Hippel-Lindau disease tumor supressor
MEDMNLVESSVKSVEAVQKTYLTFYNATQRTVDVIWINYQGKPILYKSLLPGQFFDVDTYVTHPWIFRDSDTRDTLVAESKEFFLPPPWNREIERYIRREDRICAVPRRVRVHITIPVYSLFQRAMQVLRNSLLDSVIHDSLQETNSQKVIDSLGLPTTLKADFIYFLKKSFQGE